MTDAEINLAIARIEYPDAELIQDDSSDINIDYKLFVNYVEDWDDIGPIIEREELDITCWGTNQWSANNSDSRNAFYKAYAETPNKAAALCYLKMKGVSDDL